MYIRRGFACCLRNRDNMSTYNIPERKSEIKVKTPTLAIDIYMCAYVQYIIYNISDVQSDIIKCFTRLEKCVFIF